MHPLIADGGEMTVLRDLAAFSYGRWSVDWPESVPDEQRPELPDDRDFGYASKLKQDPGRFGRRFVRADVTIKAQDFDEAGKPIPFSGESDVEETLDDASKRTDGDVFFEREITRAGLGALQPRVDFDVDSVVPVLIWGKTIPSPVTSIEDVVEQGAVVDYRVHVGGQLLQDDAARERANREVEATIAQERRERVKAVSKERKARTAAVAAESRRSDAYADSVASGVESRLSRDFEASYERYSKALTQLGDEWRQELQEGLSAEQKARVESLRQEQLAREQAGTDLRGQLEKALDDAVAGEAAARRSAINAETSAREKDISSEEAARKAALAAEEQARSLAVSNEARARQKAISDLSTSFTTELQTYGELVKEAKNYVDPATQQVVNFWSKENQNNFNKAVQLTLSAQAAYNDVNNIKWVSNDAWQAQQEKINEARDKFEAQQTQINAQNEEFKRLTRQLDAQQTEQIEQLTAVQQQMAEESQGRIREIMATPAGTSDPDIPVKGTMPDGTPGWNFVIKNGKSGSLFEVEYYKTVGTDSAGTQVLSPHAHIINTIKTSKTSISCEPNISYAYVRWAEMARKQVSVSKSGGSWDLSRSSWEYVMSYPAPTKAARQATLRLKVTWAAATYDDTYGIRLRAGDRTLKTFTTSHLGPVTVFGDGEQWMSLTVSNKTIEPGETIKVDVYSTATFSGGRRVKRAELTGTWIEDV